MKRIGLLLFALLLALSFGAMAGHNWASPDRLVAAFSGDTSLQSQLLMVWRLPRVLAAALVGALLGLGGTIFQGVFRNPLAEPYLLGSSGGAAIGATVALLVPLGLPAGVALAGLSFLGAWSATWLVLAVAGLQGRPDTAGLLLAGAAITAMLGALRSFLTLALSDDTVNLQVVLSWTLGGIQTPDRSGLLLLAGLVVAALVLPLRLAYGLDLLGLGEEQAFALGLDPRALRPHRGAGRGRHCRGRRRLWRARRFRRADRAASGALVEGPSACRDAADKRFDRRRAGLRLRRHRRAVLPPAEVPLGLITALFGGPFFLLLLARRLRA